MRALVSELEPKTEKETKETKEPMESTSGALPFLLCVCIFLGHFSQLAPEVVRFGLPGVPLDKYGTKLGLLVQKLQGLRREDGQAKVGYFEINSWKLELFFCVSQLIVER